MYKQLLNISLALIMRPAETWRERKANPPADRDAFLSTFVYPYVGIYCACAFIGVLFTRETFSFEIALKSAIIALIISFGGFFLVAYLLNEICAGSRFAMPRDLIKCYRFTGYSAVVMFLLGILLCFVSPDFAFLLHFFTLYTIYIIWEGSDEFMEIEEPKRVSFTAIASALIILTPYCLRYLLSMLMPGLRI